MNRYEFEVLRYIEREGKKRYRLLDISNELRISYNTIVNSVNQLIDQLCLIEDGETLSVSTEGLKALEPYRANRAIILGAGWGSRLMPATATRPKPMVYVNGTRIIDSLIEALLKAEIMDIVVVGGYRFEVMNELFDRYPFIRLLENKKYEQENNISSALLAKEFLAGGCYICEADVFITNPEVIQKYHYTSDILGSWSLETDDWCFKSNEGYLFDYKKAGTYCYNYYGISYWTDEDGKRLVKDWEEMYEAPGGKDLFWEFPPFIYRKDNYRIEIRPCSKRDVVEIDNYNELCLLDKSYS